MQDPGADRVSRFQYLPQGQAEAHAPELAVPWRSVLKELQQSPTEVHVRVVDGANHAELSCLQDERVRDLTNASET